MKYSYVSLCLFLIFNTVSSYAVVTNKIQLQLENVGVVEEYISLNKLPFLDPRFIGVGFSSTSFREGNFCATPLPTSIDNIDSHRSLLVHDVATLSAPNVDFSLHKTLSKMASQVVLQVPGTTAESIFQQMWDTQNESANPILPANIHCDDNGTTINGYPQADCPRAEGQEASGFVADITARMAGYQPTALVNRIDLSHKGWKNCGEHRIIYGKRDGFRKNLMIFEAVLPNPKPGCRSGCRDVIEFWANLSNDIDPASRAIQLQHFFYNGLPGFSPVIHVNHYSSSAQAAFYGNSDSGQIRTNQFLQFPWLLKEFKTLTTCRGMNCEFDIVPISVKGNPYGELWNKDIANGGLPFNFLATSFQATALNQVTNTLLGHSDINQFSHRLGGKMNAADSVSQANFPNVEGTLNVDNYRTQLNAAIDPSFRVALNVKGGALMTPLTANQIANRAIALSCAGCHKPDTFGLTTLGAIGPGQSWPDALAFVHVDVDANFNLNGMNGFNPVNFGGNTNGFNISPALLDEFLPSRKNNLVSEYNNKVCNCVPNFRSPGVIKPPVFQPVRRPILDPSGLGPLGPPIGPLFPVIRPITPLVLTALPVRSRISSAALAGENLLIAENTTKNLINPDRLRDARQLLELEDERVSRSSSKKEADNSFQRKREIIRNVENRVMEEIAQQSSSFVVAQPSDQVLEKVVVSGKVMRDLSAQEKAEFKVNLANDLDQQFPPRETVTGSFRTH